MEGLGEDLKPLFIQWVQDAAITATKRGGGGKMALFYNRALDKLRKFDQPIRDPKTLRSVQYIGGKTVQSLTKQLRQHCSDSGLEFPKEFEEETTEASKRAPDELDADSGQPIAKKQRKRKQYIPRHRSGGFAIMIGLYLGDKQRMGLSREEIIKRASPYSDKSFSSNPGSNDFYSAWSSIKILISNEIVDFSGRSPKVYYLTDKGLELAKRLAGTVDGGETENQSQDPNEVPVEEQDVSYDNNVRVSPDTSYKSAVPRSQSSPLKDQGNEFFVNESESSSEAESQVQDLGRSQHDSTNRIFDGTKYDVWLGEEYEIILIIDNREIRSQQERDFFHTRLSTLNVKCETRALTVGDVLWIAKHTTTGKEVVLDYICERKRFSDLVMSIKDGRFQEQKNRLKKTGMTHHYYIVEENGIDSAGESMESVKTSLAMTMTVSHFYLKKFRDIDETISFLASITQVIKDTIRETKLIVLKPRTLNSQSEYTAILLKFKEKFENRSSNTQYKCVHMFSVFQQSMAKTGMMTVKEAYILMLMAIRGISLERAITIQSRFQTPSQLIQFYNVRNRMLSVESKKLLMMQEFKDQVGNKKIGRSLSETIYEVWGSDS